MGIEEIYQNVVDGKNDEVEKSVSEALEQGIDADEILKKGLILAMSEVGRRFEEGEYYVPEMLISARAMKAGLAIIKPHLIEGGVESAGKLAIGTVQGDLHDIGKNLVAMMLEGSGYEVSDLGVDVKPDQFVQAVRDGAQVIGMSALLTTTMISMETTIQALEEANVREGVKVIVGGAPVTEQYARQIGADGFAPDASSATRLVNDLIQ
jgi:5-methyltetrahydrofolate--homocysteine methyltransferase